MLWSFYVFLYLDSFSFLVILVPLYCVIPRYSNIVLVSGVCVGKASGDRGGGGGQDAPDAGMPVRAGGPPTYNPPTG